MLAVLALLGITITAGALTWARTLPRMEVTGAARLVRSMVYQARMQAIFTGYAHFVVIDPSARRVDVYIDNGSTAGTLDALDKRVGGSPFPSIARLAMPATPSPLSNPFGGAALTSAWSLPNPTGGVWSGRKGVMVTTTGVIQTVETTPVVVGNSVIVFSDQGDKVSAVGIRGRMGQIRTFEYANSAWTER
jgi:type II secretory pathway pseudopilin PulG